MDYFIRWKLGNRQYGLCKKKGRYIRCKTFDAATIVLDSEAKARPKFVYEIRKYDELPKYERALVDKASAEFDDTW